MKERLLNKNWGSALAEVGVSIAGTLGLVFLISLIFSQQPANDATAVVTFAKYFQGGQISLPILSLSGIIFLALFRRHRKPHPVWVWVLFLIFMCPIIATAFIIGLNPGFGPNVLGPGNIFLLWIFYAALHALWFFVLLFERSVPSPQEVAAAQEERVGNIKPGTAKHA